MNPLTNSKSPITNHYLHPVQDEHFKIQWNSLLATLEPRFGGDLDIQAILFIIGLQELGHGYREYGKDEKMNIMHIAICSLLEPFGYYDYEGRDADNWPHWKATSKLPNLQPGQQQRLMQEAIIEYFEKGELI
ncbi:MAG: hypothetical protein NT084_07005 [Bacteroidetes bacterium]|jgi:hypothetical protein|nr:hypothetical protein [Bacteroidota bacterium]